MNRAILLSLLPILRREAAKEDRAGEKADTNHESHLHYVKAHHLSKAAQHVSAALECKDEE